MGKITISTKGSNDDIVTIQCYGNVEKMKREDAIRQYLNLLPTFGWRNVLLRQLKFKAYVLSNVQY